MNLKRYISILIFISFLNGFSQISYKKVDSTSYALYQNKNWKALMHFAEIIKKENYDYFYYNLRVGIAYYNLKQYSKSVIYFEKALKNNSTDSTVKEYLYWNYIFLNQPKKAKIIFNSLDKKRQQKIKKEQLKPKYLDFIYLEGGQNFKNDSLNDNITYFNLGLNHQLTKKLSFYQAYYYQAQKQEFNDFVLHRYYAKPTYKLKNNLELNVQFNYSSEQNNINFYNENEQTFTQNDVVLDDGFTYDKIDKINEINTNIGEDTKKEYQINLGVTKYFNKLKVGVFGGIASKKIDRNTTFTNKGIENVVYLYQDNEVYNEDFPFENINNIKIDSTALKTNFGMLIGYNVTKKLGIALETSMINYNNQNELNYVITIDYKLNNTFDFTANYIQKGNFEYYYYQSAYQIPSLNKYQRFGMTSAINLSKKIAVYTVYQYDLEEVKETKIQENSNTFIIGLKYKL